MSSDEEFIEAIMEIAAEVTPKEFKPYVFHNKEGDCLEFFVSPEDFYGRHIDAYLTLYLSEKTKKVVGFVIKQIKYFLDKRCSDIDRSFILHNGEIRIEELFVTLLNKKNDLTANAKSYQQAFKAAKKHNLVKIPFPYEQKTKNIEVAAAD